MIYDKENYKYNFYNIILNHFFSYLGAPIFSPTPSTSKSSTVPLNIHFLGFYLVFN